MRHDKWKRWEIALALALTITLSCGFTAPAPAYWWGVIFPQLSGQEYAYSETLSGGAPRLRPGAQGVEVRFRIAEWVAELFTRWK